ISVKLPLGNAVANADGNVDPVTVTLPDELQSGAHPLDALGQGSGRRGTATLWIRGPEPWLVLDSYDVQQYGDLGLVARGFVPLGTVQVLLEPVSGGTGAEVGMGAV